MRGQKLSIFLTCLCVLLAVMAYTQVQAQDQKGDEVIVVKNPKFDNPQMPKVLFNHDKHVMFVDKNGGDCSRCHSLTSKGFSTSVLNVGLQKKSKQISYMHETCTACHKASGHGPFLVECRSCHVQPASMAEASE
ncbi:MAG: cytochrome c3 family protein [Desulfovibrio sp.]|nr:cytochrome c3 family protein [Desulfovibrio sp.]